VAFRGAENHANPQFTHAPRRAFPTVLWPFAIELKQSDMSGPSLRSDPATHLQTGKLFTG